MFCQMKIQIVAYFDEAQWFHEGNVPTIDKYMQVARFEQERGHVASAIECYVKQYSVSKQQAYDEFNKQIANAWKDINQGFLRPTSMPVPILTGVLNLTRVVDIIYKENDEYTHVGKVMKDNIASLLIDPVPV
ncbi:sesquiterpene synthase 2 [Vitis vinifera]|uniref:sesquiterpene synthase 2 n=1 Tax=Vitis vinifera TaxID=29760 RepID=UPI0028835662|nr:sesquiterpene synthase 2 [Vitis vinifera]